MKLTNSVRLPAALLPFLAMVVSVGVAQEPSGTPEEPTATASDETNGGLEFGANVYLWTAGIHGDAGNGADIDVDFTDVIENLDLALMGTLSLRKDKVSGFVDLIFMDLDDDSNVPITPGFALDDVEVKAWIATAGAGYRVHETERFHVDAFGGFRFLYLDAELDFDTSAPLPVGSVDLSSSEGNWDAIIGARGQLELDDRFFIPYYFDMGTGESDFTWQAMTGLGYAFDHWDLVLAYRYLSWNLGHNDALDKLVVSGPVLGAHFRF